MERIKITDTLFSLQLDRLGKWGDIKHLDLQDDDTIQSTYVEPYHSENNSWDGYFIIEVFRDRWETDDEFNLRIEQHNKDAAEREEQSYQHYLKLKEKFKHRL